MTTMSFNSAGLPVMRETPLIKSLADVVRHYNFMEKCEKFFKEEGLSIIIFRLNGEGRKRAYRVTSGGSQLLEIYPVGHLDRGQEQLSENFISLIDQRVVEDCDMDVLMNALKETIVERMEHESTDEILAEIKESSYDELLEDFEEETA
jgi:6-phosphogluconolactonase/glucosamine-6-phosphate isomerase/deaminase